MNDKEKNEDGYGQLKLNESGNTTRNGNAGTNNKITQQNHIVDISKANISNKRSKLTPKNVVKTCHDKKNEQKSNKSNTSVSNQTLEINKKIDVIKTKKSINLKNRTLPKKVEVPIPCHSKFSKQSINTEGLGNTKSIGENIHVNIDHEKEDTDSTLIEKDSTLTTNRKLKPTSDKLIILSTPKNATICQINTQSTFSSKVPCKTNEEDHDGGNDESLIGRIEQTNKENSIMEYKNDQLTVKSIGNQCSLELIGVSDETDSDDSLGVQRIKHTLKSCLKNGNTAQNYRSRKLIKFARNDTLCSAKEIATNSGEDEMFTSDC